MLTLPDPFWCGPLLLLTARLQLSICARCVLWQVAVLVSAGRQRRGIGSTSSCAEQQCSLAPPVNSPCRWQALEMSPFMRVVLQTGCAEQCALNCLNAVQSVQWTRGSEEGAKVAPPRRVAANEWTPRRKAALSSAKRGLHPHPPTPSLAGPLH